MTCEECLSALETESLREITADSAVMRHCATCPDCARVTTMVRDKEYETATVLNSLPPMSDPLMVAETAGLTAHRRRVGGEQRREPVHRRLSGVRHRRDQRRGK